MKYVGKLVLACTAAFVFGVTFANTLAELLDHQEQKKEQR